MKEAAVSKRAAVSLILLGFSITELQLYPGYRTDSNMLANASAFVALVLAGLAALSLSLLLTRHELGGGVTAMIVGPILFLIFLRSGEPAYYYPPVFVFFGGLFAISAYAHRLRDERRFPTALFGAR